MPRIAVRQLLHAFGYRYRLHEKALPGKPDLAFPGRRKIIEIRGCFWHGHGCFPLGQIPRTRTDYWAPKIGGNRQRDLRNIAALCSDGWQVLELWECDIRRAGEALTTELTNFLGPPKLGKSGANLAPSARYRVG